MDDPTRSRGSATQVVMTWLIDQIAAGELQPGDRAPGEAEVAQALAVGRGTVREAIRSLATMGILDTRHGGGSYITDLEPGRMFAQFAIALQVTPVDRIGELSEIRRVLESHSAAMAAARMTAEDSLELHRLLDAFTAESDPERMGQIDTEFHHLVSTIGGNRTLAGVARTFHRLGGRFNLYFVLPPEVAKGTTDRAHRAVVAALDARDPGTAAAAMSAHVLRTATWLTEHIQNARGEESGEA
ncbi:FadR/GntR family transcriptional regulator [Pseudactinotalea suaedae]|uniref:FadR/GntR family transcriptional regulator n=1 Tax=Pseudactinotalea suaedae TaxID=1524924 RepID=UPI0012E0C864|nr:FCD domain-containing protein [Pseudactinotalea suaedae]